MKLRTKLLLGVGILLFAMAIVMYTLPTFFVRKDVYRAAEQVHQLLIEDHHQLIKSQQTWLLEEFGQLQGDINSILFMLYEEPSFSSKLAFTEDNPSLNVWEGIASVAGYNPNIGFVQARSSDEIAVVTPHFANLYPVAHVSSQNDVHLMALHDPEKKTGIDALYTGLPLPKSLQMEKGYTLYALISSEKIAKLKAEVQEEIAKLTPEMIEEHLEKTKQLAFTQVEKNLAAYFWAVKINLIRSVAPLFVEGLTLKFEEGDTFVPEGIARVDSSGNGLALLTEEVFRTTPLVSDQAYYEMHSPGEDSPPIGDGFFLVGEKEENAGFLGNTLLNKNTFISIGIPLAHIVKQLALTSNKVIVMSLNNSFWLGFDGQGNKLPPDKVKSIVDSGFFDQKQGMVKIDDNTFYFARISSMERGNLVFYELHPFGNEQTIVGTLFDLEDKLSNRISLQLSFIALGAMALVMLFIGRIGFTVIKPITKLAQATEDVVAGRYGDVKLPDVGKRKDEVAILTHSFGSMVHGLQDRERIRGVLDKVVSKDVADEILRTQIHLGGEDRVVTMLFSDIRGFTELTENTTPQKTIQMLNGCMTKISRVIEGEGGVIDKYVGDEVMAIYGAPTTHSDHALRAVSSGMLIVETLKRWNEERAKDGEPPILMGIGIHTGLVVAGNMGAEDRLNYTVLGSNVNLASRLCDVAGNNQLIISEATLSEPKVAESFYVKLLDPIALKGITEPVSIYEVIGFKWDES